jgi:hypothetical protein
MPITAKRVSTNEPRLTTITITPKIKASTATKSLPSLVLSVIGAAPSQARPAHSNATTYDLTQFVAKPIPGEGVCFWHIADIDFGAGDVRF